MFSETTQQPAGRPVPEIHAAVLGPRGHGGAVRIDGQALLPGRVVRRRPSREPPVEPPDINLPVAFPHTKLNSEEFLVI